MQHPRKGEPRFLTEPEVVRALQWGIPVFAVVRIQGEHPLKGNEGPLPLKYTSLYKDSLHSFVRGSLKREFPKRKYRVVFVLKNLDASGNENLYYRYGPRSTIHSMMLSWYPDTGSLHVSYWTTVRRLLRT